jgi:redox-sensitive bicupin YhaK (pirin superfamily)
MIRVRRGSERGHFDHGWLDTYHTFSFADYYDPQHMHFRALRVMNEDRIGPGQGFGMHPHRDMEIVTYVLEGSLAHRDSLGTGSVIGPGQFQRMTAGTGILHSEYNASDDAPVHLYQIWILPDREGLKPGYEERSLGGLGPDEGLQLVASPDGRDGSLTIHQDARIYVGTLEAGSQRDHPLTTGRYAWLQVLRGQVELNGELLNEGDGAAVGEEPRLELSASDRAEVMLFDLN